MTPRCGRTVDTATKRLLYRPMVDDTTRQEAAEHLAQNVRQLRDARGLSQQQLARLSGVPRATWATIEAGGSNPTLAVLLKAAAALQVSLEELVGPPRGFGRLYKKSSLRARRRGQVEITELLPDPMPGMQMERFAIPGGAAMTGIPHTPGTREYLCCERGRIELSAGGAHWSLGEGDVVVFRGDQKHSYRNAGKRKAVAYSVVVLAPG